jgi:hypothetical protein
VLIQSKRAALAPRPEGLGFRAKYLMTYRNQLLAAAAGIGLLGFCAGARAETIAVDNGIAVKESSVATPSRGMTMDQVSSKFGAPTAKIPAVGSPPISRWEYPGFIVYFEADHVIHSVVADASAPSDS